MKLRLAALLMTAVLTSCDYTAGDEVIYGQAVATVQKPSTDFTQYTTFTVANTVQVHDNTSGSQNDGTRDAQALADYVKNLLIQRGYTYVPYVAGASQPVDLFVAFDAYLGSSAYGGYWCNWYYWGYPYGCYPYYAGTYEYGTLVLQMGDRKNAGTTMTTVWAAAMYGLLGTDSYNAQIIQTSIDRAFAQSPYVHK